jgi:Di-haem cytochrome c peroxidase
MLWSVIESTGRDQTPEEHSERHPGCAQVRPGAPLTRRTRYSGCHDLAKGGVDGRVLSIGSGGQPTAVNAPTVLNAVLNFKQFWNGRADSLEAQVDAAVPETRELTPPTPFNSDDTACQIT